MTDLLERAERALDESLANSGYLREIVNGDPAVRHCVLLACAMEIENPEHGLDEAYAIVKSRMRSHLKVAEPERELVMRQ